MRGINNIAPTRTTGDIDFAVLVNDRGVYEDLRAYLVEHEHFHPIRDNSFVLLWKDKTEIDLLPFGAIEDADGKICIEGTGYTSIHVKRFREIYDDGLPELELGDHRFKFCTLPGLVVLILIAWDDRPEIRRDDIKDISEILLHFFNMYGAEIWSNHRDLFLEEQLELTHIGARVMAREIYNIAQRDALLFTRISLILSNNTSDMLNSNIAEIMAGHSGNSIEENVALLKNIQNGFMENRID